VAKQAQTVTVTSEVPPSAGRVSDPDDVGDARGDLPKRQERGSRTSVAMITNYVPGGVHHARPVACAWGASGELADRRRFHSEHEYRQQSGPQIDPKDIDTLEVQRGSYSADYGDSHLRHFQCGHRGRALNETSRPS